jgi:hypothetical protein
MRPNYINKTPINDIDPENDKQYIPFTQMYLGIRVLKEIEKPNIANNKSLLNDFYLRTQNFLKISCIQIKKSIILMIH